MSAFEQVKKNKGAAGVDKVTIKDYEQSLEDNLEVLQQKLKTKDYPPNLFGESFIFHNYFLYFHFLFPTLNTLNTLSTKYYNTMFNGLRMGWRSR